MLRTAPILLASVALLVPGAGVADAASTTIKVPAPSAGKVTVASAKVTGKVSALKVANAPKGSVVTGAVKGGRLTLAVALPKRASGAKAAAAKKLTVRLKGKRKPKVSGLVATPDALATGAKAACASEDAFVDALGRRISGSPPAGYALALASAVCAGKTSDVLTKLGLDGRGSSDGGDAGDDGDDAASVGGSGAPLATPSTPSRPSSPSTPSRPSSPTTTNPPDPKPTDPKPTDPKPNPGTGGGLPETCNESGFNSEDKVGIALNGDCGQVSRMVLDLGPLVTSCNASAGVEGWSCTVQGGNAVATGPVTEQLDLFVTIARPMTCVDRRIFDLTIAGKVVRLDPMGPWRSEGTPCTGGGTGPDDTGGGTPEKAACANGIDDDADGQVDAVGQATASDPDPGCDGAADTSEGSEQDLKQTTCGLTAEHFVDGQGARVPTRPYTFAQSCGAITGVWLKTPAAITSCQGFTVEGNAPVAKGTCAAQGKTAMASTAASTAPFGVTPTLATGIPCGTDVTVAVLREDAPALEVTGTICD